jgi:hypothetical protein
MIRALCAILLTVQATHAATTLSVTSSADAYLSSANPTSNFGNAGALSLAGSGAGNTVGPLSSVLRFDLASMKSQFDSVYGTGGWVLDSFSLQLTAATPNNPNFNANAAGSVAVEWVAGDSWAENTITWNGIPGLLSGGTESLGSFSYGGASSGSVSYGLTSSAGFLSDLQSGALVSMLLSAGDPNVSMTMNSRNFGTPANRPQLFVTASAIPEPSRLLLLALGAVIFLARRRP